jgi:hypothetical protein
MRSRHSYIVIVVSVFLSICLEYLLMFIDIKLSLKFAKKSTRIELRICNNLPWHFVGVVLEFY